MRRLYGSLLMVLPLVICGCGDNLAAEHDDEDHDPAPCVSTDGASDDSPSGAAETGEPGTSAAPGTSGGTTAAPDPGPSSTTSAGDDSTAGNDSDSPGESASDSAGSSTGDDGDGDETTGGGTTGDSTTGEGSTGEGSTGEGSTGGGDDGPSFAGEVWPIFADACGCHKDSNGAGGLVLKKSNAFDNMVGKPSDQLPEMKLVEPGDSSKSYLWHKLKDTQKSVGGKGKKMPPGGLLDKDSLAIIQQWIDQGAAP